MGHRVRVIDGKGPVNLPNKTVLDDGEETVLTDAQFAALGAAVGTLVTDLGAEEASGEYASPADLTSAVTTLQTALGLKEDASVAATDAEVATIQSALTTLIGGKVDLSTYTSGLAAKVAWQEGPLASRPTASSAYATAGGPVVYFATDDNGGTVYKTATGTAWTKVAAGATEPSGQLLQRFQQTTGFSTSSTSAVDITGWTGMAVTGWGGDVTMTVSALLNTNTLATRIVFLIVDDLANTWFSAPFSAPNPVTGTVPVHVTRNIPVASIPQGTTRTFKAQMYTAGAATVSLNSNSVDPALIEFRRSA